MNKKCANYKKLSISWYDRSRQLSENSKTTDNLIYAVMKCTTTSVPNRKVIILNDTQILKVNV